MKLEEYYNKFNEEKRLLSRHGQVEFFVTTKYLLDYLSNNFNLKILDVGAGTGRYSIFLYEQGFKNITAVELCKPNIGQFKTKLKKNGYDIKVLQGNALDLSKFNDNEFDVTLIFGPMYHLHSSEEKIQVLKEASRVTKNNGYIFVAYVMNDYCVVSYGFIDNHILETIEQGKLNNDYHATMNNDDLYDYVRVEDIDYINKEANLIRKDIIGVDGPTDYIRHIINKMDEKTFKIYKDYCYKISSRKDMIGSSSHTLDILINKK